MRRRDLPGTVNSDTSPMSLVSLLDSADVPSLGNSKGSALTVARRAAELYGNPLVEEGQAAWREGPVVARRGAVAPRPPRVVTPHSWLHDRADRRHRGVLRLRPGGGRRPGLSPASSY